MGTRMDKRIGIKCMLVGLVAVGFQGCAITHDTSILVGTPRPATSPEQVKLYTSPPKRFVEIALVSADAAHDFMSKQALLDKAVLNVKKKAAKVGANGIILDALGDLQLGSSGIVFMQSPGQLGTVGTVNRTGKKVSGKAIFVSEE